ncbi:HPr family phosphocarrier protein [Aurantiacibacter sp. MUD11]|uniref:HPr family phosphocarrier protein n=1 Tax=Aurantiacibacter sp. MUD11 TaxID=3003265 RepID=UPI0022AA79A3|nr:HPr family phosphocarrier protein [Aurantiacibacter sp. MUD11]WAT18810.1 HPr family phosphocarrier protein [Aurantiacibacter sp. MUD11]
MREASKDVVIPNKRGLHARASAKFVAAVAEMDGHTVSVAKDGQEAAGGSILGLMMLGAAMGDTVTLRVAGPAADDKLGELVALVEGKFGED